MKKEAVIYNKTLKYINKMSKKELEEIKDNL